MKNKKTILITGGAKGLGKKTALILAEKGYRLVINYRNSGEDAFRLSKQLENMYGTKSICIQGDVADLDDCNRIVEKTLLECHSIDAVVHNAGPYIHERTKLTDYSIDDWHYLINGNLNAVFYLSRLVIPLMRKNHWGRFITMGFDRVETAPGWVNRSAYAAAKTGLASLTRTIALEEAEFGITANMVCPGDIIGDWKEKGIRESVKGGQAPIGRYGTGEDIARVIRFLLDEESDFITGCIIPVSGGMDVLGKITNRGS
nr:SDR family oxidoreductase [Neobacillus sp. Marseille-Q6967]